MIRRVLCVSAGVLVVVTSVGCRAPGPASAMAVLERSKAALAVVERVRYHADYGADGWVKTFVPSISGEVVMGPKSKWDLERFRCDVTIQRDDSSDVKHLTAGSNGDVYFLVDPTTKTAHEDMDPAVLGSQSRDLQRVLLSAFVDDEPFGENVQPETVSLGKVERIGGEPCYAVRIKAERPPEIVWLLSKRDFLPRRLARIFPNRRDPDGPPGSTVLTITNLEVNPTFDTDPFVLQVPPGFTKTDEFAP